MGEAVRSTNSTIWTRVGRLLSRHGLLIALVVGLGLRLAAGAYLGFATPPGEQSAGADAVNYEEAARSLAAGEGYLLYGKVSALRPPGYPMMLSLLYRTFGPHYVLNPIIHILFGLVTIGLTWYCARLLGLNRLLAGLAALMVACLPLQLYYTHKFLSETTAALVIMLTTVLLVLAYRAYSHSVWRAAGFIALAGLANGYSVLTRPNALLMLPAYGGIIGLLALWQWWRKRQPTAAEGALAPFHLPWAIAYTLLLALCTFLAISPWTYRNYRVFNEFVLVSTVGGMTFWGSNNALVADPSHTQWGDWLWGELPVEERAPVNVLPEPARDKAAFAKGKEFLRNNPDRWLPLYTGKAVGLISPVPKSGNKVFSAIIAGPGLLLQLLTAIGLWMIIRSRRRLSVYAPILAAVLMVLGTTVLFYCSTRFRTPTEPLQAIVAALAIGLLGKRFGVPLLEEPEVEDEVSS